MTETIAKQAVVQPMVKFQRQVESLVKKSKVVKPSDPIWKIAFLFGDDWSYWRQELEDFDFTMQDPIADLLAVQSWEED
jgi:hypothetical protein